MVKAGYAATDFIVQIVSLAGGRDDIVVVDEDGSAVGKLSEVSPLMKTLTEVLSGSNKLIVACDKKNVERVGAIVRKLV